VCILPVACCVSREKRGGKEGKSGEKGKGGLATGDFLSQTLVVGEEEGKREKKGESSIREREGPIVLPIVTSFLFIHLAVCGRE